MMMINWVPDVIDASRTEEEEHPRADAKARKRPKSKPLPSTDEADGKEQPNTWCVLGQLFRNCYAGGHLKGEASSDCGQGGAASTNWTVNLSENVAILWFAQLVDDLGWDELKDKEMQDLWTVVNKGFKDKVSEFRRP